MLFNKNLILLNNLILKYQNMNKLKFLIPILSLLLVFNSCDKDEEPTVYRLKLL